MSDAFGFDSAEYESVDDSGDLTPYDFRDLERKARYNALPDDIKECLVLLRALPLSEPQLPSIEEQDAAITQLLDHFGAL